jgi:uncharacterized protein YneF (UPF0154 family)
MINDLVFLIIGLIFGFILGFYVGGIRMLKWCKSKLEKVIE